jgi:hypothetical protein
MATSPTRARASSELARVALGGLLALAVVGSAGCGGDKAAATSAAADDPAALAEDGTDAAGAETDAELVTSSLVSATAAGGSLSLASVSDLAIASASTAGLGDGAKALYFPKTCLTVTSDVAVKTVTYDFAGCTGPNGIFRITGRLVATYAVTAGTLVLDLVASNLLVNRSTVDWSAHAEITAAGAARTMTWRGQLAGVTARGKEFGRTNDKIIGWNLGDRCFSLSGVSDGHVRNRALRTEIADFRRCQGACPEAGGRITITNQNAKLKVEILYDGTSVATYTTPKGKGTFDLACKG